VTLRLQAGGATDVGRTRNINQDSFLLLADRSMFAVADGMGGHQGGEVASQIAVQALRDTYVDGDADGLVDAIEEANLRIHEAGEGDPDLRGMGTTVVAVAVVPDGVGGGSLLVANVGDSRGYLFRGGDLTQITEDHSMVADLVREGRITEAEAEVHPQRNIVTRVLGVYDSVDIDLWPDDAVEGDRILLCSDGLFNEVAADQIASVLRRLSDPQEAADELVRRALEGGGRDNVTVVVVDVTDDGGVAEAASSALAGAPSGLESEADLAGFSTTARTGGRAESAETESVPARTRVPLRQRITWRVVAFLVVLAAVIGGAFAAVVWYATSYYYVGFDDTGAVTVYQGHPGGVLWIDPKVVERHPDLTEDNLRQDARDRVEGQAEQTSRSKADRFVENLSTTTTTTTTLPVDPATTVPAPPPSTP
jgi:protein phosphatase